MAGPRKTALQAGVYAAGSLGAVQDAKRGSYFRNAKACRMGRHAWLFGAECAVCSVCGLTVEKAEAKP